MKRKITYFEKWLIDNNWVLTHKSYTGKLAKRVLSYTYEAFKEGYFFELVLNPKRTDIIDLKIRHNYYSIGYMELQEMDSAYNCVRSAIECFLRQTRMDSVE